MAGHPARHGTGWWYIAARRSFMPVATPRRPPVTPQQEESGERAARRALGSQIARLDRDIGTLISAGFPRLSAGPAGPSLAGPRLLSLGELERIRDALAARLSSLRHEAAAQAVRHAEARELREAMLLAPGHHKWVRVTQADVGEPGCGFWEARPRLGLIGMLMGWWCVKVSSGCPLPG
jgi:hypothetical protein